MMGAELIQGQHLANSFITFLPPHGQKKSSKTSTGNSSGAVDRKDIPLDLQLRLPELFIPAGMPKPFFGSPNHRLFNGDISNYGEDHSAADMALTGYLVRKGLTPDQVDMVFRSSGLHRDKWDEMHGETTYGDRTIAKAFEILPPTISGITEGMGFDLATHRAQYIAGGMPARLFIGPYVDMGIRLFPAKSLSALVALGSAGKTSLLIAIAAHIAAGKKWNDQPLQQTKVVIFSVEETQEELNRKFSALVDSWSPQERQAAIDNQLLVSLLGQDARLTVLERGQYRSSGIAEKMIQLVESFGLRDGLIILDHMQGFASGDLNISETATSICREANKIVDATGAAVVFAAHISKANIKAEDVEQGFAVGSLAFENSTRQMSGMITMTEEQAKKYCLEHCRKEYVWLGVPKNSYGNSSGGMWLRKVFSLKYHTVVMEPVMLSLPVPAARKSANEKLADRLVEYLTSNPWVTKNQLDGLAGEDGIFKASKQRIRDVLGSLIDTGWVDLHPVTAADKVTHGLGKQVNEVLKAKPAGKPAKPADKQTSSAG
jgi:hypothetical protein